jgi:phosphate starvation-inducible protein PhoH and related proteins
MELSLTLLEPHKRAGLFGAGDRHLRRIREALSVRLQTRNATIRILGEPTSVAKAAAVIERLQELIRGRDYLDDEAVEQAIIEVHGRNATQSSDRLMVFTPGTVIAPKTDGQQQYIEAMLSHDLTFCVGPAGTGKTYLAVAVAIHLLKAGQTNRIALVRPAVEAGEKLGFLPGDLQQKVNPYLRPLFDAMHDMMTFDQLKRFLVNDIVEVIPLAYMRGRTLNNAVIILDEAQNCTPAQMLMFLTRLGHNSRMIVTGDDSQSDLEPGQPSGLIDALQRLGGIAEIGILRLTERDIIRHRLVQVVVARYAEDLPQSRRRDHEPDKTLQGMQPVDGPGSSPPNG